MSKVLVVKALETSLGSNRAVKGTFELFLLNNRRYAFAVLTLVLAVCLKGWLGWVDKVRDNGTVGVG